MKKGNDSHFARVAQVDIKRSLFPRPSTHKTTMNADLLTPIFIDEVLPGDTFKMRSSSFCRLSNPIKPSMDNLHTDVHYFFVPNRLLWDNWEKFMGAQDNPGDSVDYLVPKVRVDALLDEQYVNTMPDYFGIPNPHTDADDPTIKGHHEVCAFPFRAYNLIFNEWYRDQNLQDSVYITKSDETVSADNYSLLKRGKRHDYFTSSLPFPQKGEPVGLSLSGDLPIVGTGTAPKFSGDEAGEGREMYIPEPADDGRVHIHSSIKGHINWDSTELIGVMDGVTAVTINALRQAFQLQKFLERDARSGTRYIEIIKSHFGVTNPDYRLQRPEYLGGTKDNVVFTTVAQTSESATTPQGNLSALAISSGSGHCFNHSFTEHGFIIGIASIYGDLTYQSGINRMWKRDTRVDYYWPEFAHLGEQEVFNYEIYADGFIDTADTIDNDSLLFGYQERYAEYRYSPNRISSYFRSSSDLSLDVWHYAEDFDKCPLLNADFISYNTPIKRNSALVDYPDLICDFYFDLTCIRPMPMYGTPGFVDHF
ncbi:MAG: major capsid protein [Microviridae sp.]|nr:MAG: major capsid protein [Microviridae sp.]